MNSPKLAGISEANIRYAIAAAMDMANMSVAERDCWYDDAIQVAWMAIIKDASRPRNWLLSRARWAVFYWICEFVYDSPPEYVDENTPVPAEDASNEEWLDMATFVTECFVGLGLKSAETYAKIFMMRARGDGYQNIAITLSIDYDAVRSMASRARNYLRHWLDTQASGR